MTTFRERGIIFNGPMVRAILDNRKTQTRRLIKLDGWIPGDPVYETRDGDFVPIETMCPYRIGDFLWVRETWSCERWKNIDGGEGWRRGTLRYRADGNSDGPWRSSRYMPKWAARIWLRVTGIRVEQVQDISEENAIAEGVAEINPSDYGERDDTMRGRFGTLWDSIHGAEAWERNDWIWAILFERTEKL